jgi:hypothetical protein
MHLVPARGALPFALFVFLALAGGACRSSTHGGSPGPTEYPSPCPAAAPAEGDSCNAEGLACEFGDATGPACNQRFTCTSGQWSAAAAVDAGLACNPDYMMCRASYDMQKALVATGACAPVGLICGFAEGTCGCVPPSDMPQLDGGPVTQASRWECVDLDSGCPFPRPHEGDGCPTPNEQCNYAVCQGGIELTCSSGHVWESLAVHCQP